MTSLRLPGSSQLERVHAALEAERGSAYLLAPDLSLRYVNEGWRRFARENGAPELASSWASSGPVSRYIAPQLRKHFEVRYLRVLTEQVAWSHEYECSSARVYRKFNVSVQCTAGWHGLMVIHSLVAEGSLTGHDAAFDQRAPLFTDCRKLIVACSSCGRLRRADGASWEWAPGLVTPDMENVSHGVCATCELNLYGDSDGAY